MHLNHHIFQDIGYRALVDMYTYIINQKAQNGTMILKVKGLSHKESAIKSFTEFWVLYLNSGTLNY